MSRQLLQIELIKSRVAREIARDGNIQKLSSYYRLAWFLWGTEDIWYISCQVSMIILIREFRSFTSPCCWRHRSYSRPTVLITVQCALTVLVNCGYSRQQMLEFVVRRVRCLKILKMLLNRYHRFEIRRSQSISNPKLAGRFWFSDLNNNRKLFHFYKKDI